MTNKSNNQSRNGGNFRLRLRELNIPDEKLLDDLRRVADEFGRGKVSRPLYQVHGRYSHTTMSKRFGSWNKALNRAKVPINNEMNLNDERLFENIEKVWMALGRQPGRRDMVSPHSPLSMGPYLRRFGSWNKSLQAFIDYINEEGAQQTLNSPEGEVTTLQRGSRDVGLRMRFRVMQRDCFKCRICGKSPATDQRVILHIDHIVAWSKGGPTEIANLRTLCSDCNLGKSNLAP